ncbi:hypothetical protein MN608_05443 [Microdochium nivale]|nr:hypothetical protein MN608_05443 [Microdochium nivale]
MVSTIIFNPSEPHPEEERSDIFGVFHVSSPRRHRLANSTLVDNCSALHLVNSKDLLMPRSITPAGRDYVEVGNGRLPITCWGTRIIKRCLTGPMGKNTCDLTLTQGQPGGGIPRQHHLRSLAHGQQRHLGMQA